MKMIFQRTAAQLARFQEWFSRDTEMPLEPQLAYKRFLTNKPVTYNHSIEAAERYADKLAQDEHDWLYSKPFDPASGNPQYFRLTYDLLNILRAMDLPPRATILEVGCGSGWITEILLMLGYSVHALEPAEDLNRIAQHRCEALKSHYQRRSLPEVHFHQSTLEEIEFAENQFDAILFFDVLHHVVDENLVFAKTYRFLKPGGRIGVIDPSWHPDFKDLEDQMVGEMQKFGTLENPFSTQYLDHLLTKTGFIEFVRVVSVNGMFSKDQLDQPIRNFAHCPIEGSNNITAFKPTLDEQRYPSCCVAELRTDAQLTIVSGGIDASNRSANLVVDLKNTGETRFDCRVARVGHVRFALRKNPPGSADFVECTERPLLSEMLLPGQSLQMSVSFALPVGSDFNGWELDLVADDAYWFSTKNISACNVAVLAPLGAEQ